MNARNQGDITNTRLLNRQQAAQYTGMGVNACRAWCDRIGATRILSERVVRFDKRVIDAALDGMTNEVLV